jgi:uracil-DNA glycosylase
MSAPLASDDLWHQARALLEWQVAMGVSDALAPAPIDRYKRTEGAPRANAPAAPLAAPAPAAQADDPALAAARSAAGARDLEELAAALAAFDGCDLRNGARNCVFADGNPKARVMLVGEGPGREEDLSGLPFVGPAGQLLDRMFAAIGMARTDPDPARALYITNTVPWRPPGNREPDAGEIALLRPFLMRHIELVAPDRLVLMGNVACAAVLGRRGIMKLRGAWHMAEVGQARIRALPMLHPANLLRNPENKAHVWADLLMLQADLRAVK